MTVIIGIDPAAAQRNCREGLMSLARNWDQYTHWERQLLLCAQVHESWDRTYPVLSGCRHPKCHECRACTCGRCLGCAWEAFRADVAKLDGLEGQPWAGEVLPSDVDESLTGDGASDAARDSMWKHVDDALRLLMRGPAAMRVKAGAQ